MYNDLIRRKKELETEYVRIYTQEVKLKEQLKSINEAIEQKEKELKEKEKEISIVIDFIYYEKLRIKQQKVEKAEAYKKETAKKIEDLTNVLSSKSFYYSIRKCLPKPKPHWKKLTKAIQSDELFTFILKHHYANRVIKAYKNDVELNEKIMEAIVDKIKKLIK